MANKIKCVLGAVPYSPNPRSFWRSWLAATLSTLSPCCLSPSGSLAWRPGLASNHLLLVLLLLLPRLHLLLIPNLLFPLNAISMMASVYMTLALAVERLTHSMRENISYHPAPKVVKVETLECCKNPPPKVPGCIQTIGLQQDGHRRQFSSQVECFRLYILVILIGIISIQMNSDLSERKF